MSAFDQVTIIGPGLIGASLGMAIRAGGLAVEVVGVGRRQTSLDTAREAGAIDRATLSLEEGVKDADLVVLAAGVETSLNLGIAAMPHLRPGCLLTDVASAKCFLIDGLAPHVRTDVGYVSGHPMAGSEKKGPGAARQDLFQNALCILTPTTATRPGDMDRLVELWEAVGTRTCELDAPTHDLFLAQVSHLPHVAASCLVNSVDADGLKLSAGGFRDTTRVASGDPEIWKEICLCNRDSLLMALRSYLAELQSLMAALESHDGDALVQLLASAKARRDAHYGEREP